MDFILFFIGLISLIKNKLALTLAIIVILTSTYFQVTIHDPFWKDFLFRHNTSDIGLLLYILFFIKEASIGKVKIRTPLTKITLLYLCFLLINGLYDYYIKGTDLIDIINFLKLKMLLTIVFIAKAFSVKNIIQSYKYILYATLIISIIILITRLTGFMIIEIKEANSERGVKTAYTAMLFALLLLSNIFHQDLKTRILYCIILVTPIILNLKMTYSLTILFSSCMYIFISKRYSVSNKMKYGCMIAAITLFVASVSDKFSERFNDVASENIDMKGGEVEGNFSFRILHAYERLSYICEHKETMIRGLGYVSERNFKKEVFATGLYDEERGRVYQLDTGDIAWSLLFVRYGFLGILIFLAYYLRIIREYMRLPDCEIKYYWLSILPVFLLFTSLGNAIVIEPYFFIYPILFLICIDKENRVRIRYLRKMRRS